MKRSAAVIAAAAAGALAIWASTGTMPDMPEGATCYQVDVAAPCDDAKATEAQAGAVTCAGSYVHVSPVIAVGEGQEPGEALPKAYKVIPGTRREVPCGERTKAITTEAHSMDCIAGTVGRDTDETPDGAADWVSPTVQTCCGDRCSCEAACCANVPKQAGRMHKTWQTRLCEQCGGEYPAECAEE